MTENYLSRVQSILGEPTFNGHEGDPWPMLEQAIGASLPGDFKAFVEKYGPGLMNSTLYIMHPSLGTPTLYKFMVEEMESYTDLFPRIDVPFRAGVETGQLIPFAHMMDSVDLFFLVEGEENTQWRVCAFIPVEDELVEFPWGFGEWLVRYLEDDETCVWLSGAGRNEPKTFTDKWAYR